MNWGRRGLVAGVALATAVLWWGAAPAQAHNQLIGSDPSDEQTLDEIPEQVELSFLASLDPDNAELDVTGPDGASVLAGEPEFDGAVVTVPVAPTLAGDYEVSFEVLSNDGHWVDGTVSFTLTTGVEPSPTPEPSPSPAPAPSPPSPEPTPEPAAAEADERSGLAWWMWLLIAVVLAAAAFVASRSARGRSRQ